MSDPVEAATACVIDLDDTGPDNLLNAREAVSSFDATLGEALCVAAVADGENTKLALHLVFNRPPFREGPPGPLVTFAAQLAEVYSVEVLVFTEQLAIEASPTSRRLDS